MNSRRGQPTCSKDGTDAIETLVIAIARVLAREHYAASRQNVSQACEKCEGKPGAGRKTQNLPSYKS